MVEPEKRKNVYTEVTGLWEMYRTICESTQPVDEYINLPWYAMAALFGRYVHASFKGLIVRKLGKRGSQ